MIKFQHEKAPDTESRLVVCLRRIGIKFDAAKSHGRISFTANALFNWSNNLLIAAGQRHRLILQPVASATVESSLLCQCLVCRRHKRGHWFDIKTDAARNTQSRDV